MPHQQLQSCIDACNDCALACDHCAASCLKEQDVKGMARCIALDIDCGKECVKECRRMAAVHAGGKSASSGRVRRALTSRCAPERAR